MVSFVDFVRLNSLKTFGIKMEGFSCLINKDHQTISIIYRLIVWRIPSYGSWQKQMIE